MYQSAVLTRIQMYSRPEYTSFPNATLYNSNILINFVHLPQMYVCTVISPKAGWIPIQCRHQMRIPTHPCTRRHTHINTHTAHSIPPLRGVLSQELNIKSKYKSTVPELGCLSISSKYSAYLFQKMLHILTRNMIK
jgi:hypothetical protein